MNRTYRCISRSRQYDEMVSILKTVEKSGHIEHWLILAGKCHFIFLGIPFIILPCWNDTPPAPYAFSEHIPLQDGLGSCIDNQAFLLILRKSPLHFFCRQMRRPPSDHEGGLGRINISAFSFPKYIIYLRRYICNFLDRVIVYVKSSTHKFLPSMFYLFLSAFLAGSARSR